LQFETGHKVLARALSGWRGSVVERLCVL